MGVDVLKKKFENKFEPTMEQSNEGNEDAPKLKDLTHKLKAEALRRLELGDTADENNNGANAATGDINSSENLVSETTEVLSSDEVGQGTPALRNTVSSAETTVLPPTATVNDEISGNKSVGEEIVQDTNTSDQSADSKPSKELNEKTDSELQDTAESESLNPAHTEELNQTNKEPESIDTIPLSNQLTSDPSSVDNSASTNVLVDEVVAPVTDDLSPPIVSTKDDLTNIDLETLENLKKISDVVVSSDIQDKISDQETDVASSNTLADVPTADSIVEGTVEENIKAMEVSQADSKDDITNAPASSEELKISGEKHTTEALPLSPEKMDKDTNNLNKEDSVQNSNDSATDQTCAENGSEQEQSTDNATMDQTSAENESDQEQSTDNATTDQTSAQIESEQKQSAADNASLATEEEAKPVDNGSNMEGSEVQIDESKEVDHDKEKKVDTTDK